MNKTKENKPNYELLKQNIYLKFLEDDLKESKIFFSKKRREKIFYSIIIPESSKNTRIALTDENISRNFYSFRGRIGGLSAIGIDYPGNYREYYAYFSEFKIKNKIIHKNGIKTIKDIF